MTRMSERKTEPPGITPLTRSFPHAMLREIYEQPEALAATIERYVPGGVSSAETFQPVAEAFGRRERLVIAASGSSRHAGLAGEIMLEDLAGIPVDVEYASEYTYRSTHTLHNPGGSGDLSIGRDGGYACGVARGTGSGTGYGCDHESCAVEHGG